MKKYLYIIALVGVFCSCVSTMKVRVDVLNKQAYYQTFLYKMEYLDQLEKKIYNSTSASSIEEYRNASVDKVFSFLDKNHNKFDTTDLLTIKASITAAFDEQVRNLYINADTLLQTINLLRTERSLENTKKHDKALGNYNSTLFALKQVMLDMENILITSSIDKSPEFLEKVVSVGKSIEDSTNKLSSTFGDSILSDPSSSIIAILPSTYWRKIKTRRTLTDGSIDGKNIGERKNYRNGYWGTSRYNFTNARTFLGNSDIAIKMDSPGEFTIKGVRVDADEAVRTSFKVLSQGIKYMAFANGIPVKGPSSSPNKTVNLPELDSLTFRTKQLNASKTNIEYDLNAFIEILIDASKDINATGAKKQVALERIEKAYNNLLK